MIAEQERVVSVVKQQVAGLRNARCILFGSRARGDHTERSDYDLLIVVDDPVSQDRKFEISGAVRRDCARLLIPADVIVKGRHEFDEQKNIAGTIVRNALAEGVRVL